MKKKFGLRVAVIAVAAALLSQSAFAASGKLSDWTPFEMVKGKKTPITMTDGGVHMEGAGTLTEGQGMGAQYNKKVDITNFSLEYTVEKFGGLLGKDPGSGHFINFGFHTEKGGLGSGTGFYLSQYQAENETTLMTFKVVPGQNSALVNHLNLPASPATTKVFKINIKCNDKEEKVEVRFNNSFRFQNKEQNMTEYVYQIPYSSLNIEELKKGCYFSLQACDVGEDQSLMENMPTKLTIRKINDVTFAKDETPASSAATSSTAAPSTATSSATSSAAPVSSQETSAATSEVSSAPAATTSEDTSAPADGDAEGSFPVWAIVVIAVVVVAGVAVIIFFAVKKKNAGPSDPTDGSSDSNDQN